jgi:hypothetical protein
MRKIAAQIDAYTGDVGIALNESKLSSLSPLHAKPMTATDPRK